MGNNVASPIEAERKQAIQSYKECIDLAGDLNSGICLYVAGWIIYGVDEDQAWEWSGECLKEIAAYAKTRNVAMAVEPTAADGNLIESAEDALKMMRDVNLNNVKVMFDTIHVLYRKEVATDYVEKLGSDLIHVHISDLDRTPPGTHTDFSLLVDALKANGYQGYVAMEIGLRSRGKDVNGIAKTAHDYLRKLL